MTTVCMTHHTLAWRPVCSLCQYRQPEVRDRKGFPALLQGKSIHSTHHSHLILLENTSSRFKADSRWQKEVATYFSVPTLSTRTIHTYLTPFNAESPSPQNETQLTRPAHWYCTMTKACLKMSYSTNRMQKQPISWERYSI